MKSAKRVADELEKPLERYVFWRESRDGASWYKFYGVFMLDTVETRASKESGNNVCIYRKVSDEGVCPRWDVEPRTISDGEFLSVKGKILTANLLDNIHCEAADGTSTAGEVKVWPGQKFLVKGISAASLTAVCLTEDCNVISQVPSAGELSFSIPKRDIELGYFSILDGAGTTENTLAIAEDGTGEGK